MTEPPAASEPGRSASGASVGGHGVHAEGRGAGAAAPPGRWWSRRPPWQSQGVDPDYRFSLANERTFLAWIRTALALLAGGMLLHQFSTRLNPQVVGALATVLCALSAGLCALAYLRWRGNEIAMRHARRLPGTMAMPLLAVILAAVGGVIAYLLLQS